MTTNDHHIAIAQHRNKPRVCALTGGGVRAREPAIDRRKAHRGEEIRFNRVTHQSATRPFSDDIYATANVNEHASITRGGGGREMTNTKQPRRRRATPSAQTAEQRNLQSFKEIKCHRCSHKRDRRVTIFCDRRERARRSDANDKRPTKRRAAPSQKTGGAANHQQERREDSLLDKFPPMRVGARHPK